MNFDSAFKMLTGFAPLRWQARLYEECFSKGEIPLAVSPQAGTTRMIGGR